MPNVASGAVAGLGPAPNSRSDGPGPPSGVQNDQTHPSALAVAAGWVARLIEWGARRCELTTSDRSGFEFPLYTVAEAARIVAVPPSTLAAWAKGYIRRFADRAEVAGEPVVTCLPAERRTDPCVPFVGLAEALVLAAVRRSGVPLQGIRPALAHLQQEIGLGHALASHKLYTDGAELLFDYGESHASVADGAGARRPRLCSPGRRLPPLGELSQAGVATGRGRSRSCSNSDT
ncbi:MAG: hypothetical protein ACR2G7_02730 [Acidimicrobiales bacterium]